MEFQQECLNDLVKPITFKTCVGIYDDLRKLYPKLYQYGSYEGVELTIDYADNWQSGKQFDKVVVAIHGTPGYYSHFEQLVEHFHQTNVRVIVPNLPSFDDTRRTSVFWHSTIEKVQFLKDLLALLNVTTIDCLISHSFGIQTIAALWEQPGNIKIKSVALFAPQPLWNLEKWKVDNMNYVLRYNNEIWYGFLTMLKLHKWPSVPMKFENFNEFLIFCSIILDEQAPAELYPRLDILVKLNIPVALVYGSKETLVPRVNIEKLYTRLGIKKDNIIHIDPSTESPDKLNVPNTINYYNITNGGHFSHAKFSKFANKIVENLINHKA